MYLIRFAVLFVLICLTGFLTGVSCAFAKGGNVSSSSNPRYAAFVMDAHTGAVYYDQSSTKPLHPASLTKIMTLLLLFEAIDSGSVRLNDNIPISRHAAGMSPSKLGLKAGTSIRVGDAILAIVTKSANDISVAVAEYLGGTESRFAQKMTRRARDIGMSKTRFTNASGLHDANQVSTARDMAIMARYILIRFPSYYHYFSARQFTYRGVTMNNHNRLMQTYKGMDGFKTGFVNASGYNLVASAKRGNTRLIGVIFGGRTWKSRNDAMANMLDQGFSSARLAQASGGKKSQTLSYLSAPPPVSRGSEPSSSSSMALSSPSSVLVLPPPPKPSLPSELSQQHVSGQSGKKDSAVLASHSPLSPPVSPSFPPSILDPDRMQQKQKEGTQKGLWSVQIGAYTSRVATDEALRSAASRLPSHFENASPIVVPLQTAQGVLFRARLANLTENQATQACRHFEECVMIAPR